MSIQEIMVKNVKYLGKDTRRTNNPALQRLQQIIVDIGNDYSDYQRILDIAKNNGVPLFKYYDKYSNHAWSKEQKFIECAINGIFIRIFLEYHGLPKTKVGSIYSGTVYTYGKGYGYMTDNKKQEFMNAIEGLNLV